MKLIVGLGNPGEKYEKTRHNVGFMAIDLYAKSVGVQFTYESKFEGSLAIFNQESEKVILLKPATFMNLSGVSVRKVMDYYKIPIEDILIVMDDIYLEVAKIRLREKGSHGGQNGLKSIERYLHSNAYKRVKIGIGLDERMPLDHYVLSNFSKDETIQVEKSLILVSQALDLFSKNVYFKDIMTQYNTQPL